MDNSNADEPRSESGGDAGPRLVSETGGLVATNLGKRFKNRPVLREGSPFQRPV